jgi:proteasome accessory factor B
VPGGDKLTLPYADAEFLADQIVGYGADVRVEGPPELRDAVIQRLKEVVTQLGSPAHSPARSPAAKAVAS